jgi:hypothetical protein
MSAFPESGKNALHKRRYNRTSRAPSGRNVNARGHRADFKLPPIQASRQQINERSKRLRPILPTTGTIFFAIAERVVQVPAEKCDGNLVRPTILSGCRENTLASPANQSALRHDARRAQQN